MDIHEARQFIAESPRTERGCWEWQGSVTYAGYGCIWVERKRWQAHRLAYTLFVGEIPKDLCVLHRCDFRLCCNPEHLVLGTRAQNMAEMYARGRQSSRADRQTFGHRKLTEDQVLEIDRLYAEGWSQERIAPLFGVHQTAISKVIRRQSWQHIRKS